MVANGRFRFAIDRGGTFTDIYAEQPDGSVRILKLLSEDPEHYADAPQEGIRRIIQQFYGCEERDSSLIDPSRIEWIRMGTTVATNALLERKGERCLLLVTEGLVDLLRIGYQSRPDIFDLRASKPSVLYDLVAEIPERIRIVSAVSDAPTDPSKRPERIATRTGQYVEVLRPPALEVARQVLTEAFQQGIRSVAIVFMHAYAYDAHERLVGEVAKSLGFDHITLSSSLTNMQRIVPRGLTCLTDAYLTPCIRKYLETFQAGFQDHLRHTQVELMQSDGGLCPLDAFSGYKAILSGPAGGVIGYAKTIYPLTAVSSPDGKPRPVIGFDMGGTSTDVSRYAGQLEHVLECETAGVMIQAPQLDVQTVAAGGGSRLYFRSGLLQVGPESAGANPGPVCYRRPQGQLAVTDANAVLGRLQPHFFPAIFGPNEDQPLDVEASRSAFASLLTQVNHHDPAQAALTVEELALGFIRVANEAMCRPIRSMTESRGYDPAEHVLACFGGAGGQHACAVASNLGMSRVYIHRYAGVLSAYGIGLSESVEDIQEPCALDLSRDLERAKILLKELEARSQKALEVRGIPTERIHCERFLHLRYEGTDIALLIREPTVEATAEDYVAAFEHAHEREHGFLLRERLILIDNVRVRAAGQSAVSTASAKASRATTMTAQVGVRGDKDRMLQPLDRVAVYFADGWHRQTPVYALGTLEIGDLFAGPALLVDPVGGITILVEPGCQARVLSDRSICIDLACLSDNEQRPLPSPVTEPAPVKRSIFAHRFMSIAEQMGRTLQRTAVSTNIKERLDFSCALFDAQGGLVANAPHIPVHLGSMQDAVRRQVQLLGDRWQPGEVIATNHPAMGGTHLPDITVITAVFQDHRPAFFVASRGHHADIGGLTPGSMPPFSRTLADEGAAIASLKLVEHGVFQEARIRQVLVQAGCRCLPDVLSDLRAQIAANQRGIQLMEQLIQEQGLAVVEHYMREIQRTAATFVRDLLREVAQRQPQKPTDARWQLDATDWMDDGSRIQLQIEIDVREGTAVFDFTGTDAQVVANWNAPASVAASAIIYCLRCLIGRDIPLNQGFLEPITIRIPPGSLLDPRPDAAVVGGNVLTSQRVTDVVLRAFGACAASQGCMNNLTFGNEDLSYYETIGGGAGAGPGWHGESGVQVHMTNTRMTDPELLELRYPVLLRRFRLRPGSGGRGRWHGGDGIERELEFLQDAMHVSILSERRVFAPYGLEGGSAGARGQNWWLRRRDNAGQNTMLGIAETSSTEEYEWINLGNKQTIQAAAGDRIRICTPGGGGFGIVAVETPEHSERRPDRTETC
jgi:5-oxoprolinase (ATP-hydrolysing)